MPFRFECKTCDMKFQVQADYQKHIQKCGSIFTEMTPNELNPKSRSKKKKLPKTEGKFSRKTINILGTFSLNLKKKFQIQFIKILYQ